MTRTAVSNNSLAKLGVNCTFNATTFNDSATQVPAMNAFGINRLRTGIHYNDSQAIMDAAHAGALAAKNRGMYVMFRVEATLNNTFDTSSWAAYKAAVVAEATYLQTNGLSDQLNIGNEMENAKNGTITTQAIYDNMIDLAAQVKAVYSGKISYAFSSTNPGVWNTNAAALVSNTNFDYLGANIYGGWNKPGTFSSLLTTHTTNFGAKAVVTEFGIDSNWANVPTDADWQASELSVRMATILAANIDAYFYDWRDNSDNFGVRLIDGSYRVMFCSLFGGRRFLTV